MSTIDEPIGELTGDLRLIALGTALTITSSLLGGWLLVSGDIPTGVGSFLLTISGILLVAIGSSSPPAHRVAD